MSNNVNVVGGHLSFDVLLTLVFITLKLCGVITWSWLWVLSPLWIPAVFICGVLLVVILYFIVSSKSGK